MRINDYNVNVYSVADGAEVALPAIQHDDRIYIVTKPGNEYVIKVQRTGSTGSDDDAVLATTKVDGIDVGYSFTLVRNMRCTFRGFVCAGKSTEPAEYAAFKFAQLPSSSTMMDMSALDAVGTISVAIYHAVCKGDKPVRDVPGTTDKVHNSSSSNGPVLPDGDKKFFMAPSLTTQMGGIKKGAAWSTMQWVKKTKVPIVQVEFHYETATTLLLRKVLDPMVSAHLEIIRKYGDDTAMALLSPEIRVEVEAADVV